MQADPRSESATTPLEMLEYFRQRSDAIIELIREIVEIESPSHDAKGSRDVVSWIEKEVQKIGLDAAIEKYPTSDGDHLVVRVFRGHSEPILLLGHTDTVHPVKTNLKNPTRVDGDKFFGCGIFDMKANIVLVLEALRFFKENGIEPARPINILLSCDEEIGSSTGREYVEREAQAANHCLIFEPSAAGSVKTGRKGTAMYTVSVHGVPAHAGLDPEKGASAILEISQQIERLHTFNDVEAGTTVNVCTVRGGTTTNVIPEHAECTVDVRFTSMTEAARIDAAIKGLTAFDERISVTVTGGINRPPMERTEAVVSLYERARRIAESFGYDLGEMQVGGASDGNFVGALGVPVLDGLGITGDGAHTLHEHVLISDIPNRAALITRLLMEAE
ncbi:MAG TPA: M20 family metallopeptidase [Pyrinomonadaceae bacterium]|nr:M20 family metallopeptidase [Pyrinomonadaceae bacterium]